MFNFVALELCSCKQHPGGIRQINADLIQDFGVGVDKEGKAITVLRMQGGSQYLINMTPGDAVDFFGLVTTKYSPRSPVVNRVDSRSQTISDAELSARVYIAVDRIVDQLKKATKRIEWGDATPAEALKNARELWHQEIMDAVMGLNPSKTALERSQDPR